MLPAASASSSSSSSSSSSCAAAAALASTTAGGGISRSSSSGSGGGLDALAAKGHAAYVAAQREGRTPESICGRQWLASLDATHRIGLAWALTRTFGLDMECIGAQAAAEALAAATTPAAKAAIAIAIATNTGAVPAAAAPSAMPAPPAAVSAAAVSAAAASTAAAPTAAAAAAAATAPAPAIAAPAAAATAGAATSPAAALEFAVKSAAAPSHRSASLLLARLGQHLAPSPIKASTQSPPHPAPTPSHHHFLHHLQPAQLAPTMPAQPPPPLPVRQPPYRETTAADSGGGNPHRISSSALAALLPLLPPPSADPPIDQTRETRSAEDHAALRSTARIALVRLCAALHGQLAPTQQAASSTAAEATFAAALAPGGRRAELRPDVASAAHAALLAAPVPAARTLAQCGCWQPLVLAYAAETVSAAAALGTAAAARKLTRVEGGDIVEVDLPTRLAWLRAAAGHGALSLAQPSLTAPSVWSRLLGMLERPKQRHCEDACTLVTLALLPPPPGVSEGAALGSQLEVFLRHWLTHGWPRKPLRTTLRANMRGAAPALCWLLEQRPTLMAQAALGPELLLDAIRIAACRTPSAGGSAGSHAAHGARQPVL